MFLELDILSSVSVPQGIEYMSSTCPSLFNGFLNFVHNLETKGKYTYDIYMEIKMISKNL